MNAKLVTAFAAIYLIWGTTYLGVALAVESIPPFLLMAVRSLIAGALLFGIALLSKEQLPTVRDWAVAVVTGLFLFVAGHGLLAYGQTVVPSGLAAVLLTTIPFWMLLINSLHRPKGDRVCLPCWRSFRAPSASPLSPGNAVWVTALLMR